MTLFEITLEKLRKLVVESSGSHIPSLSALSRRFNTARSTVLQAARYLRNEGVLEFRRGSAVRITGRKGPEEIVVGKRKACEILADRFRASIRDGVYRAGESLPKMMALSSQLSASHHTIGKALDILQHEGLIYRDGISKRVGRKPEDLPGAKGWSFLPVILVLVDQMYSWRNDCISDRTGEFGRTFVAEANRCRMEIRIVITQEDHSFSDLSAPPAGRTEIAELIGSLGNRYAGTLISANRKQIDEIESWMLFFKAFGMPVVWFDKNDEGFREFAGSRLATRSHICEKSAVAEACRLLHELGHRRACFAWHASDQWCRNRFALMRQACRNLNLPVEINWGFGFDFREPAEWTDPSPELMKTMTDLYSSPLPGVKQRFDRLNSVMNEQKASLPHVLNHIDQRHPCMGLIRYTIGRQLMREPPPIDADAIVLWDAIRLFRAIDDPQTTALVFPNDSTAISISRSLAAMGVSVLQRFAAISFDNHYRYTPFPFTTIDFGFAELGYRSFHAILRDIPVPVGRGGDIAGRPFIVHPEKFLVQSNEVLSKSGYR